MIFFVFQLTKTGEPVKNATKSALLTGYKLRVLLCNELERRSYLSQV